jgi:DNA-binding IclR family transcriptional regulator
VKETSKYKLGMKLFQMGCNVVGTLDVRDIAHEGLQKLVTEFQEVAAHLVTHDRGEVIYLDKLEGYRTISIVSRIGWRYPMYATGVGKVMLAFLGDEYLREHIFSAPLKKFTPAPLWTKPP